MLSMERRLTDRFTLKKADEVVAVNDFVKRELVRQGASEHEMLIISIGGSVVIGLALTGSNERRMRYTRSAKA